MLRLELVFTIFFCIKYCSFSSPNNLDIKNDKNNFEEYPKFDLKSFKNFVSIKPILNI